MRGGHRRRRPSVRRVRRRGPAHRAAFLPALLRTLRRRDGCLVCLLEVRRPAKSFRLRHRAVSKQGRGAGLHSPVQVRAAILSAASARGLARDGFVPVPLHPARLRERDFNQAAVLSELIARRAGKPVLHAIRRLRYTTTQTRLERHQRMENLRNAFCVRHTALVQSRHLILVDDVFTTGSTVDECARVLRAAGAASVRVVTVARG